MVGACVQVRPYSCGDRCLVAPSHQPVDEAVAELGDVLVANAHPPGVVCVPAYVKNALKRGLAGGLSGPVGVGVADGQLIDDESGLLSQDLACPGGVVGCDE